MARRRKKRYRAYKRKRMYSTRRSMRKASCKPEVKWYSVEAVRQSVKMTIPGASWASSPSAASSALSFQINNILQNITTGADVVNRIGRQIFVKSIRVHHIVELCSPNNTTPLNTGLLRLTWCTATGTPQSTSFSNWYKRPIMDRVMGSFNNNFFKLHYNKVHNVSGYLNNLAGTNSVYLGAIKHIKYTLPVNRIVSYDATGAVKEEKDFYSLFMQATCPSGYDGLQVYCVNIQIVVYFTDC